MCNVPLISVLFIAAQLGFVLAMGLVATAGALNASLFLAGKSPLLLIAAIAAVGGAMASLRAAYTEAIKCASCISPAMRFIFRVGQLITTLSALAIAIAAITVLAAIHFAAVVVVPLILIGSLATAGLFILVAWELISIAVCVAARPVPLPPATIIATIVAGVLTVLLAIAVGGLVIVGALAGLLPFVPLPLG